MIYPKKKLFVTGQEFRYSIMFASYEVRFSIWHLDILQFVFTFNNMIPLSPGDVVEGQKTFHYHSEHMSLYMRHFPLIKDTKINKCPNTVHLI